MAREKHVRWTRDPVAKVAKMLAWAIVENEKVRGVVPLWERFAELLPAVTSAVLGQTYTRDEFCDHITQTQGGTVTPNMLRQRADKAQRYGEFNDMATVVLEAYFALLVTPAAATVGTPGLAESGVAPEPSRSEASPVAV